MNVPLTIAATGTLAAFLASAAASSAAPDPCGAVACAADSVCTPMAEHHDDGTYTLLGVCMPVGKGSGSPCVDADGCSGECVCFKGRCRVRERLLAGTGRGLRIAGGALMGPGLALTLTGAVSTVVSQYKLEHLDSSGYDDDIDADHSDKAISLGVSKLIGNILLGLGTAAFAASVILLVAGSVRKRRIEAELTSRHALLAPWAAPIPGGALAGVSLVF
jgi:hypothetical protein